MAIKIEIKDNKIEHKKDDPQNPMLDDDGKPITWSFWAQTGYVHTPAEAYPQKIQVRIAKGDQKPRPLDPGFYELSDESFFIRNEKIALSAYLVLKAAKA